MNDTTARWRSLSGRPGRTGCRGQDWRADPHGRAPGRKPLACGGFNPSDILERYLAWWREGAFDTGPVSDRAFALLAAGMPVQEATAQVHREFGGKTAGCNPAHRSPPLAMLAAIADEDLAGCAMAEARLTHHDPLAGEVAATVNKLCRALIRGDGWDVALAASAAGSPTRRGRATTAALHRTCFGRRCTSSARRSVSPRRWSGHWRSPGLPTTARSSWAPSPAPAGALRPSRRRRWPTSKFCPGSGPLPTPWLRGGSRTQADNNPDMNQPLCAGALRGRWSAASDGLQGDG